ncbi:MAG: hypothetical protein B6242_02820 [Anaerolineaceae bacterium 4572_78]|nr:MAG: hypothetical protein B6242_02820 [Anaerolineaceae bacterium 4572_78]
MENLHSDKTTAQSSLVPTLETVQGDSAGDSFALKFKTRGGREQDNDIVVADPRASRYHFQIAYEDGQWLLTDLGSVNGTYLNSLAVSDVPQVLQNNDQIMIGETIFAFKNPIAEKAFDTTSQAVSTKKREERRAKTPSWIWVIVASVLFVFVVILVGIGFLLMGNGSNTITSPTMTAQLVPDVGGTSSIPTAFILKYEDDFSTSDSGWDDAFGAYYTKQYGNNQYHIEINTHDLVVWGLANRNAHDFEVEVEATKEEGDIGNTYGIIFRYFDHDNYYRFDVSSDGFYLITKLQNGEWIKLLDWTESPNIKQGHDTNKLKVSAIGSTMTLFANGQKLTQVTDNNNPILSGNFGFFASTFSDSHIWVSFDNFKLWATEGQEIAKLLKQHHKLLKYHQI